MNFQLDVVSVSGSIFSGEVFEVILPGISGEIGILARHMPIVTPLTVGEVIVKTPNETFSLSIGKGVFSFDSGRGRLLIEDVSSADEISEERVIEAKRKAEELLAKGVVGEEKLTALYQLRKSLVDLKIVRRKKKTL
jgi:F-type H+-transporting ATPase subunit epsilon